MGLGDLRTTVVEQTKRRAKSLLSRVVPGRVILWGGTGRGVALTFDDGPDPGYTPGLLDVLAKHDAKATFFVNGHNAQKHPELLRRIADQGHVVGNHGDRHLSADKVSFAEFSSDLLLSRQKLSEIVGHDVRCFRPPYGVLTKRLLLFCARRGFPIVMWDIDSLDHLRTPAATLHDNVAQQNAWRGHVILCHDDNPHTLQYVDEFLSLATSERQPVLTVHQLMPGFA